MWIDIHGTLINTDHISKVQICHSNALIVLVEMVGTTEGMSFEYPTAEDAQALYGRLSKALAVEFKVT